MTSYKKEILEKAIEQLEIYPDCFGADLHNAIYNSDYFIIGRHEAKQWLENNYGVFEAIEKIREYEMDNFGEVNTDFSEPEKVVNMLTYILGEEVLQDSETLQEKWNEQLTEEDCKAIISELKEVN